MTDKAALVQLENVKLGDLIEFGRRNYSHWAVYVGDDFVIHRWGEGDGVGNSMGFWNNAKTFLGTEFDKATVMKTKIADVLKYGGTARVNNALDHKHRVLPVFMIVQRAENALGEVGYNLIKKNCEHFATYCRYDQECSLQVQRVVTSAAIGAAFVTLGAVVLAFYNRSTDAEEENSNGSNRRSDRTKSKAIRD